MCARTKPQKISYSGVALTPNPIMKSILSFLAGLVLVVSVAGAQSAFADRIAPFSYFENGFAAGIVSQLSVSDSGDLATSGDIDVTGDTSVREFTQGGGVLDLVDANGGTYTLTEAQLLAYNYLKFSAGGAGQAVIALTLPATSTMISLLPNAGDCRDWFYDAASLAAGTTTTITAGTGHDVIAYTTNDDVIDGGEFAQLTMCRQADGDVSTFTSEMLHAD